MSIVVNLFGTNLLVEELLSSVGAIGTQRTVLDRFELAPGKLVKFVL